MSLLEVNPLIVMKDGRLRVLDAKVSFDNNALFRHPDIVELRDTTEEDEKEIEASKYDLAYVALDGNIGCMVNGAGLAMATMDIIKLYGAEPANFLDVGGGASKEKVTAAFKIITADPAVKGILVNIFGGIMKCDVIAEGVIAAVKEVGLKVPLVVRLEGTNVELGKKIINESGLNVISADDLDDAAQEDRRGGEGAEPCPAKINLRPRLDIQFHPTSPLNNSTNRQFRHLHSSMTTTLPLSPHPITFAPLNSTFHLSATRHPAPTNLCYFDRNTSITQRQDISPQPNLNCSTKHACPFSSTRTPRSSSRA